MIGFGQPDNFIDMSMIKTAWLSPQQVKVSLKELPINEKTGKVSYEGIVKVEGATAADLYIKANEWFSKTFNSDSLGNQTKRNYYDKWTDNYAGIVNSDKEASKIIAKGVIAVQNTPLLRVIDLGLYMKFEAGGFDFTITFTAKEGRCRYVITDIKHDGSIFIKKAPNEAATGGIIENKKPECGRTEMSKKKWNNLKAQVHYNLKSLSKDFEQYMSNKDWKDDDDW